MMLIMQAAGKLVSVRNSVGHMLWPAIVVLVPGLQSAVAVFRLVQTGAYSPRFPCGVFRGGLHDLGPAVAGGGLRIGSCALATVSACCG